MRLCRPAFHSLWHISVASISLPMPVGHTSPLYVAYARWAYVAFVRRLCPLGIRRRLRYVLTIVARIRFAFIRRLCPLGIRRRLRYVLTIVARIRFAFIRRLCPAGIRRRLRYVLTIVARICFAFIRRLCPLGIRRRLRYVLTIVARIRSALIRRLCPLGIRRRLRYVLTIVARIRSASRAMCSLTLRAYARLFSVPLRIRLCRQTLSLPSFFPIFTRTHTCGEACRSDVNAFLYSIQRLRRLRQNSGAK